MSSFSRLTEPLRSTKYWSALSKSLNSVSSFFGHSPKREQAVFLSLVKTILTVDDTIPPHHLKMWRNLAEENFGIAEASRQFDELSKLPLTNTPGEAAHILATLPSTEKKQILGFLFQLSATVGNNCWQFILQLAEQSGLPQDETKQISDTALANYQNNNRMIRSGAGLLVALIVLAVFILTATLLRSVIFGLIIAYLLLPLEKFFEHRLRSRQGMIYWGSIIIDKIFAPLTGLSKRLTRRITDDEVNADKQRDEKIIQKSVAFTAVIGLVFLLMIGWFLSSVTEKYVHRLNDTVKRSELMTYLQKQETTESGKETTTSSPAINGIVDSISKKLEYYRQEFEQLPLVKMGITEVERILNNPESRGKLIKFIVQKTGGLFSITAGIFGTIINLLCDLLLTIFFALLFLLKLAQFCREKKKNQTSEYLVKTIFNGSWLPLATPEALAEGQLIVAGTLNRLQIWAKGYLTLMLVDATVYTTVFCFLDVPYFPILGIIAGCGILLPYIGPILSAILTLLVTLACGGATGDQLFCILIAYLIYNGIIEQFILYPSVIGESLGLTTLETITVVLLGAIFAGIPGMILSLPAASVLKYLIPRIYHCRGFNTN